jgi:hypothetical protein
MGIETTFDIAYDSDEEARLIARFSSTYTGAKIIENAFVTMANDIINSAVVVDYGFKKIRHAPLEEDNLSALEIDEEAQGVSVATTTTVGDLTTMTTPEGY